MERKVGEVFTYNGKTYQVVKDNTCKGCAFMKNGHCFSISKLLGLCSYTSRTDKTGVIFKEINNMEIKNNQLTINIPKGMEVDVEKSNLKTGVIKFRKKEICYTDILSTLADKNINLIDIKVPEMIVGKIIALDRLMTIAKYYNKDWEPDWSNSREYKYFIIYNNNDNTYIVDYHWRYIRNDIYFKNREDAIAVINNPNFKSILSDIYKN